MKLPLIYVKILVIIIILLYITMIVVLFIMYQDNWGCLIPLLILWLLCGIPLFILLSCLYNGIKND